MTFSSRIVLYVFGIVIFILCYTCVKPRPCRWRHSTVQVTWDEFAIDYSLLQSPHILSNEHLWSRIPLTINYLMKQWEPCSLELCDTHTSVLKRIPVDHWFRLASAARLIIITQVNWDQNVKWLDWSAMKCILLGKAIWANAVQLEKLQRRECRSLWLYKGLQEV